ncbi:MAG: hypothetical protein RR389_06975 [Christensenella sp.]
MPRKMETSKTIVLVTGIIFAAHIVLASILIFLGYGEQAVSLMSACMPVYLSVAAGYFGKAGVENVQKIKSLANDLTDKVNQNG